ncbi:hypothetical protein QBC46DRAFT_373910 [Diplogelasinospora grovesii]|uniref:TMEM205-like domain-containing protein n=1 Tax=Diplogelasinospora grovesii TaxID=303347 RepID=A0AAN6NGC9_9PEZI|nr:hypothetical protein QBC46DRAFT_373910 [Diplogelasinospora grovesii]
MSGLLSPAPYHILSYGTLLGTTFFHTFVGGIVSFQVLPRPQFSQLMAKIFPVYFSMQTALPVVMALTFPSNAATLTPGGVAGLLDASNTWSGLVPIATMFISGLANLAVIGPATTKCMRDRKSQEHKDGKKSYDPPPHSVEMQALNKKFSMLHGISSLLNLGSFIAALVYGVTLSSRLA